MEALAPPDCCYTCQHPFVRHDAGGCARCGCKDPYALAQAEHERRMAADPAHHDPSSCVCCCLDCDDLVETLPKISSEGVNE